MIIKPVEELTNSEKEMLKNIDIVDDIDKDSIYESSMRQFVFMPKEKDYSKLNNNFRGKL